MNGKSRKRKNRRNNLCNNDSAMLCLARMSIRGESDATIRDELKRSHNIDVNVNTVGKHRRGLGIVRESPIPNFSKKTIVSNSSVAQVPKRIPATVKTTYKISSPLKTEPKSEKGTVESDCDFVLERRILAQNSVKQYFKHLNPDTLSFGELCEYTASHFEDVANYPQKDEYGDKLNAPQDWWIFARDLVVDWHTVLIQRRIELNSLHGNEGLNKIQNRAFNYCLKMYTQSLTSQRGRKYGEVYSLYRVWRRSFLQSWTSPHSYGS